MPKTPSIAIVILNWNGKALLQRFLPLVIQHSPGAQIIVADNASTDGSTAYLSQAFPGVRVVVNPENLGFAGGYNRALTEVEADIYCLLNSDVAVSPGWLEPVLQLFAEVGHAGIVQPKIKDLQHPSRFEYAGAAGGYLDRFGYPFCRGRIFQTLEEDRGQYDDTRKVFWATGACMFIRQTVFRELGGFDADYFAHQEEVDLCWRAQNRGQGVYYVGASEVFHLGGSTLSNMNPKKTFLNFRNSLFSITKNLPGSQAFLIILARLLLDGVASVRFLLQGKGRHAGAVFLAHLSYYRNLPRTLKKRERVHFTANYYATTSVVWSYYVCSLKTFGDLVKD